MLIFLNGFMGAGKSTAGKLLAERLNYAYIDLDAVIELKAGMTINDIFSKFGEGAFRDMESETLRELHGRRETIVSVGGGCAVFNSNMDWMNENGFTIYLRATHGILFHRLMPAKKLRPLIASLTDVELMEYIVNMLPVREKFYRKAHRVIDTANESTDVLIENIINSVENFIKTSAYH